MLVGFSLYQEAFELQSIDRRFRQLLIDGRPYRSAWRAVVESAIEALGGEASLHDIYELVSVKRPTTNTAWRKKVKLHKYTSVVLPVVDTPHQDRLIDIGYHIVEIGTAGKLYPVTFLEQLCQSQKLVPLTFQI